MSNKKNLKCNYHPGELIMDGYYIFDQISGSEETYEDWDYWIHSRSLASYLNTYYGLTPQEYYNLIMYGDIDHKEYCRTCGSELAFGKLSRGYGKYCCPSCSSKSIMSNLNRQWWSGERTDNPWINSIDQFAYIEWSTLTNRDKESGVTHRWLYLLKWDDRFKIGVYQDSDIKGLLQYIGTKYFNYKELILYYDNNQKVIDTEGEIKHHNKDRQYLKRGERGWTETFSIDYFNESMDLINLTPYQLTTD